MGLFSPRQQPVLPVIQEQPQVIPPQTQPTGTKPQRRTLIGGIPAPTPTGGGGATGKTLLGA